MAHRINERNSGNWSLNGDPKKRRTRNASEFTTFEKMVTAHVIELVIDCLEFDPGMSEFSIGRKVGHLHPKARFTDGGRFVISLTREQFDALGEAFQKLEI